MTKRKPGRLPKGAVPLPTGGYVVSKKSRTHTRRGKKPIRVTGVVRGEPDGRRLASALADLVRSAATSSNEDVGL